MSRAGRVLAVIVLLIATGAVAASDCAQPGPVSTRGQRLAEIALKEYREFNGHRIDARGRLWKFGSVETETEALHDGSSGKEDAGLPDQVAWRRVWHYWQSLDAHDPGTLAHRRLNWTPGLLGDGETATPARRLTLEAIRPLLGGLGEDAADLAAQALARAAIADSPWSGAFISHLMHEAGLTDREFRYSGAHAEYIRPALEGDRGYAFRACDPRRTVPRVGDLLCYSRDTPPLADFAAWKAAAQGLDGRVKSHCDLVVAVDRLASRMEVVGGNVLQSVTRRQLMLDADGHLSRRHRVRPRKPGSECARDMTCRRGDLNQQFWGVLLQLR